MNLMEKVIEWFLKDKKWCMVIVQEVTKNEKYREKYKGLLDTLHIDCKNIENYILAFIHRSVVNERPDFAPTHNERLEFLWDAVLELVVTQKLYVDFPEKAEWELTDIRSAIVRWRNLTIVSKELGFNKYLILGNGERQSWWENNDYILANTVEAFIGALYLDVWYQEAHDFILKYLYSKLDTILKEKLFKDAKSSIQEYVQAHYDVTPTYKVLEESWPDHNKNFCVWVYRWEILLGKWEGSSKKKAEEDSAKNAYSLLNI